MQKIALHRQSNDRKEYAVVLLMAILLGLAEFVGWTRAITSGTEIILNPIQAFHSEVVRVVRWPVNSLFVGYQSAEELQSLKTKYAAQLADLNELERLRKENESLKQLLENSDRTLENRKVASPVVSLSYPAVAGGAEDGILEGQMVTYQNTLLGVITDTSEHQSRVALLTKRDSVSVLAKTESGIQGIISGDGRHAMLTEIPHGVNLEIGERVATVGQEGIRRDVFIGTIREIDTRPSSPTQRAVLEQFVSFYDAPVVEIW